MGRREAWQFPLIGRQNRSAVSLHELEDNRFAKADLFGKANRMGLIPEEEQELRQLVNQENPSTAGETIGVILATAALITGIVVIIGALSKK